MGSLNRTTLLLSVLLSLCAIGLADARPSAHPNYTAGAEDALNTKYPYAIYDTVTVYVHLKDNVTNQTWTSTFWPRVDEFSQLEVANTASGPLFLSFNPNVTVQVEFNNTFTTEKLVYRSEDQLVIPYFTAVVLLDKGRLINPPGVGWQDGCDCLNKYCLNQQCGNYRWDGSTDICNKTNCNIKIYLAWSGRDSADSACKSISSTPANFQEYSLTPAANVGNGLWDDFIYKFTTTAPNPLDNAPQ